jgi:hypothetical protein
MEEVGKIFLEEMSGTYHMSLKFILIWRSSAKKINGNYLQFFKVQGSQLCSKCFDHTQNWTWPRYSYDESVYQISFQYVDPVQRKWTETSNHCNFSKSKDYNSVKNGLIIPKSKPDLDILMINLYSKFHFNM